MIDVTPMPVRLRHYLWSLWNFRSVTVGIIIIIIAALLLMGCAHTTPDLGLAPAAHMPTLPPSLAIPAKRLPPIVDSSLGGINQSGAEGDAAYNDLAVRFNALQSLYQCTKQALDAHDASAMSKCL